MAAALIGATLYVAPAAATSDYENKVVGRWLVDALQDRFGTGGTHVARVVSQSGGSVFAVRCIDRKLTVALLLRNEAAMARSAVFKVQIKLPDLPVKELWADVIDPAMLQIDVEKPMVTAIRSANEVALRINLGRDVTQTYIYNTTGAAEAFADLSKECPLD